MSCWRSLSLCECGGSLPGGQCSHFSWPQPPPQGSASVSLSSVPCPHSSSSVPFFPSAEAARQLLSLTTQPRGSKIQFISSINSINKQNSTDQRTGIAINITTHVAKRSSFSKGDMPLLFPCSYFINMEETIKGIIKLRSHIMGSVLERCWQGLQSFVNFPQSFQSFQCGFFTKVNLGD